jgi:hypothetical protein
MTLTSTKYSFQKNYFEAIFFRISDCAKNVMGYTVSKCHNRKVEKSRRSLCPKKKKKLTIVRQCEVTYRKYALKQGNTIGVRFIKYDIQCIFKMC